MAKTPKSKKKAISIHSRAARRASSPSVNVGDLPAGGSKITRSTTYTPYHVANEASQSGIRKRKSALSRNQKLRRKRGVERADATSAKVEIKKQKSVDKLKIVKERAKDWDDVNSKGSKQKLSSANGFGALAGMDPDDETVGVASLTQALPIRHVEEPAVDVNTDLQQMREQQLEDDDI